MSRRRYYDDEGLSTFLGPLFWIAATVGIMTYGPVLVSAIQGKIPKGEIKQAFIDKSPGPVKSILGEQALVESDATDSAAGQSASQTLTMPRPPTNPQQIPQYIQEVVQVTTNQIVEKTTNTVVEKKQEITTDVCGQIVTEVRKQCSSLGATNNE